MSERALRVKICELARVLYERGHNAPGDGNLSARLSERYLLCTPSAVHKGQLRPDQVVKLAASDGRVVDDRQRASSELKMHLALFAARPDVHAIIHAHSPNTVALTVAGVSMEEPVVPEVILALGGVPTVPYASPTTSDVPEAVLSYAAHHDAFILERHGTVALAADLDTAFMHVEVVEHTAKITVAALSAGGASPLDEAERQKLARMGDEARVALARRPTAPTNAGSGFAVRALPTSTTTSRPRAARPRVRR